MNPVTCADYLEDLQRPFYDIDFCYWNADPFLKCWREGISDTESGDNDDGTASSSPDPRKFEQLKEKLQSIRKKKEELTRLEEIQNLMFEETFKIFSQIRKETEGQDLNMYDDCEPFDERYQRSLEEELFEYDRMQYIEGQLLRAFNRSTCLDCRIKMAPQMKQESMMRKERDPPVHRRKLKVIDDLFAKQRAEQLAEEEPLTLSSEDEEEASLTEEKTDSKKQRRASYFVPPEKGSSGLPPKKQHDNRRRVTIGPFEVGEAKKVEKKGAEEAKKPQKFNESGSKIIQMTKNPESPFSNKKNVNVQKKQEVKKGKGPVIGSGAKKKVHFDNTVSFLESQ